MSMGETRQVTPADEGPGRHEAPGWHALSAAEAIRATGTSPETGLSSAEAARRLVEAGPNALPEERPRRLAAVFLDQFRSPLIYLLLVAAAAALALGERGTRR